MPATSHLKYHNSCQRGKLRELSSESSDQSLFACSREEQQVTMNPVNVGNLSAEDKEKMYSAATTEMEYRVELFNK